MRTTCCKLALLLLTVAILAGCGVAHVKTQVAAEDWSSYRSAYIKEVRVYSKEASATDNLPLQNKMLRWHALSLERIHGYLDRSRLTLLAEPPTDTRDTLIVEVDTEVRYGNRALRYLIGFGAGKGEVRSTLTVTDASNGQLKFQAESVSSLSVGVGGGDMDQVVKINTRELLKQFETETGLRKSVSSAAR